MISASASRSGGTAVAESCGIRRAKALASSSVASVATAFSIGTTILNWVPAFAGRTSSGGAAGAEERLELVGGAGGGEELALADAAAGLGEEVALYLGLDALGDHLEVEAAGEGDQRTREAGALGVLRHADDQAAVDAHRAGVESLQHGQRGVAGAEVVDGEARAARGDRAQRVLDRLELAQRGLGQLDQQRFRRQAAFLERRAHLGGERAAAQLARARVDDDGKRPDAGVEPAPALATGLAQRPGADRPEQADVVGEGQEGLGREHAMARVAPAQQRLGADHLARADVEARLVDEVELAALEAGAQLVGELRGGGGGIVQHAGEELVAVA